MYVEKILYNMERDLGLKNSRDITFCQTIFISYTWYVDKLTDNEKALRRPRDLFSRKVWPIEIKYGSKLNQLSKKTHRF